MTLEEFKQYCKDMKYAQLINERNNLIEEMKVLEDIAKRGLEQSAQEYPISVINYAKDMDYLMIILEEMKSKYECGVFMVDEDNEEEQLAYIRNVIWLANEQEEGYAKKIEEATRLLYKLMKRGNEEALNIRGAMYYEGQKVKQNLSRAVHWYIKAAEAGSSLAMSNLGYAYYYGMGVEVDMQMAYKYLSMAVEYEEWDAFNLLGDMYREGIYVPKDIDMAFKLYTRCLDNVSHDASNDAYPGALTRLAECIYERIKSYNDIELAIMLLNRAKDIAEEQIKAGNYYAPGILERINRNLEMIHEQLEAPKRKRRHIVYQEEV